MPQGPQKRTRRIWSLEESKGCRGWVSATALGIGTTEEHDSLGRRARDVGLRVWILEVCAGIVTL